LVAALVALVALVASLLLGVFAASSSFSDGGRPTLTKVSLVSDGGAHVILSFTVTATGVKHDNLLRAFALWVPRVAATSSQATKAPRTTPPSQPMPFYVTTLRPDDKGIVSQEVTVLLDRRREAHLRSTWIRPPA
jgi:hypothetical protein